MLNVQRSYPHDWIYTHVINLSRVIIFKKGSVLLGKLGDILVEI